MDIDITKAKEIFKEFVKKYSSLESGKINLKIAHIMRTSEVSKEIAKYLELSEEDIVLAELIGLLHDIGRFEQIKRYNTFLDKKSINHGALGCEMLFKEGLIRKFIPNTRKYDEIIKNAILNHNRDYIEEGLDEKSLLHSKIIRDADKTDIYYVLVTDELVNIYGVNDLSHLKIAPKIVKSFMEEEKIDYNDVESGIDIFIGQLAYIFDFNYELGLKKVIEEDYIDILIKRINVQDEEQKQIINKMKEKIDSYIKHKLGGIHV